MFTEFQRTCCRKLRFLPAGSEIILGLLCGAAYIPSASADPPINNAVAANAEKADEVNPAAIQVKILRDGNEITKENSTVLPGQRINLSLSIAPAGTTITSVTWTVPGLIFLDYRRSERRTELRKVYPYHLRQKNLQYYWTDSGANREVSAVVKFKRTPTSAEQTATPEAVFQVETPSSSMQLTTFGTVRKNTAETGFGLFNATGGMPGMAYTANVAIPAKWIPGEFQTIQTINQGVWADGVFEVGIQGTRYSYLYNVLSLDSALPYTFSNPTGVPGTANDSPHTIFPALSPYFIDRKDQFVTYLMFQPPGVDSQWVPLKKITWSWQGIAYKMATWDLMSLAQSSTPALNTPPVPVEAINTTLHPVWSQLWHTAEFKYNYGPITVSLDDEVSENAGTIHGTVSVVANVQADLVVSLTASDVTTPITPVVGHKVVVPSQVTILSGNSSASFDATIVNNEVSNEEPQYMRIEASAGANYTTTEDTIVVLDED